jgi:hypothetical protein
VGSILYRNLIEIYQGAVASAKAPGEARDVIYVYFNGKFAFGSWPAKELSSQLSKCAADVLTVEEYSSKTN